MDATGDNQNDVEQHIPFVSNRYPDGANASLYMKPPSSPPTNCTHDRKHQKKKGSHSRRTKANNLICYRLSLISDYILSITQ